MSINKNELFNIKEDFIMSINKNELTKEQIAKAMSCETAEELMVLAKTEGVELTKEEAEAYMAELEDFELVLVFKKTEVFYNGKNQHE